MRESRHAHFSYDLGGPPQFRESRPAWPRRSDLYFALLPEPSAATDAERLATALSRQYHLSGRPYARDRLNISLYGIGAFAELSEEIIFAVMQAAAAVRAAPFTVTLDRAVSTDEPNHPLVLCASNENSALQALHFQLRLSMHGLGLHPTTLIPSLAPHLTLLCDRRTVPDTNLEAPVTWTVREFVLVHSLYGTGKHDQLGCWPLLG
ncbi:2'-5' RNA ligase family protein [Rhizobium sp. RAF56]|jgi:2'-5' RNA ligase|uniref:2'-5' RNA ligase family protein n=1 Tax=Rhizobium sp. RAF56 TaxID=3233062 RepID=UPI003F943C93